MHKVAVDLIDLIKTLQNHDAYCVNQILDAKSVFQKVYEDEKRKLPYNINLLDEIRADENAHSRILTKILQYVQNEKKVFLETFLENLKSPFADLIPVDPEITAEKDRVDIRIRDENITIIIENKIQGASDQAKQIERYICNEKKYGYKEEQIYIIYLTSDGGSPGEDSFSTDKRKNFKERYIEINYNSHISGLLDDVLERLKEMNVANANILESAIVQYKDFLDGKFNKRKGMEDMNTTIKNLVTDKLHLDESETISERLSKINEYILYAEKLKNYLESIKQDECYRILGEFQNKIVKENINGIKNIVVENYRFGKENSLLRFKPNGWNERYSIGIGFDGDLSDLIYGIYDSVGKSGLINELKKYLGDSDKPNKPYPYWPYWKKFGDYDIDKLVDLIDSDMLTKFIKEKISNIIKKTDQIDLLFDDRK